MSKDEKGPTIIMDSGSGSARMIEQIAAAQGQALDRKIIPIQVKPSLTGISGKAWRCDLDKGRKIRGIDKSKDAGLIHWVVEAPWAHPIWPHYSILLMHLRPIDNLPPPTIHLSHATHEILVFACDPKKDLTDLVKTGIMSGGEWMFPVNFGSQMIYRSDEEALTKVEAAVKEIVAGTLSPDTDFRRQWVQRFGDVMIKEDYR